MQCMVCVTDVYVADAGIQLTVYRGLDSWMFCSMIKPVFWLNIWIKKVSQQFMIAYIYIYMLEWSFKGSYIAVIKFTYLITRNKILVFEN
jgi:hypothetical protein